VVRHIYTTMSLGGKGLIYDVIKVLGPWWDDAEVLKVIVWRSVLYHQLPKFYVYMAGSQNELSVSDWLLLHILQTFLYIYIYIYIYL
jgi:hypothetical protein